LQTSSTAPGEPGPAGAVDYSRKGKRNGLEGPERRFVRVKPGWEGHPLIVKELSHHLERLTNVDRNDGKPIAGMDLIEGSRVGHLRPAGWAPTGPGIQENDSTAVIRKGDLGTLQISELQIRGREADRLGIHAFVRTPNRRRLVRWGLPPESQGRSNANEDQPQA